MKTNLLAGILGLGFMIIGLLAFFASERFFDSLGTYYGTFNNHFVKDAGISFFCSGALLLSSIQLEQWRIPLTIGGAMFIVLHGLFHVQMLIMGMAPTGSDLIREIAIVITPAVLTFALVIARLRGGGVDELKVA